MRIARRAVGKAALGSFGPTLLKRLGRSWRYDIEGQAHRDDAERDGGSVLALWHGRMLLALPVSEEDEVSVLVSPSDDGSLSKQVLTSYGYEIIRGSTSWGGARAMRRMLDTLRAGVPVTITPDGPRGPRHSITTGVAWIARETGRAVVPVGLVCDRAWHLRSWDAFTIPKPRARVNVVYGEPVRVAPDAKDAELDEATAAIREALIAAELRGFDKLGMEPDH